MKLIMEAYRKLKDDTPQSAAPEAKPKKNPKKNIRRTQETYKKDL